MAQSKSSSKTTSDHEEIRKWAEERGGKPACVQGTGGKGDIGMLRLEFPGKPGANDSKLEEIEWEDFFDKFDEMGLALVLQETTAEGEQSNFNKLVSRETAEEKKSGAGGGASKSGTKRATAKSAVKKTAAKKTTAKQATAKKSAPAAKSSRAGSKTTAARSSGSKTRSAGGR